MALHFESVFTSMDVFSGQLGPPCPPLNRGGYGTEFSVKSPTTPWKHLQRPRVLMGLDAETAPRGYWMAFSGCYASEMACFGEQEPTHDQAFTLWVGLRKDNYCVVVLPCIFEIAMARSTSPCSPAFPKAICLSTASAIT